MTDTAVTEGNSGTVVAQFRVTLSAAPAAGQTVGVDVATADGTASAGTDYTTLSTTLTWTAGSPLTKNVNVSVKGDTAAEPSETFFLRFSSPTGYAALSDAEGTASIVDDD